MEIAQQSIRHILQHAIDAGHTQHVCEILIKWQQIK